MSPYIDPLKEPYRRSLLEMRIYGSLELEVEMSSPRASQGVLKARIEVAKSETLRPLYSIV